MSYSTLTEEQNRLLGDEAQFLKRHSQSINIFPLATSYQKQCMPFITRRKFTLALKFQDSVKHLATGTARVSTRLCDSKLSNSKLEAALLFRIYDQVTLRCIIYSPIFRAKSTRILKMCDEFFPIINKLNYSSKTQWLLISSLSCIFVNTEKDSNHVKHARRMRIPTSQQGKESPIWKIEYLLLFLCFPCRQKWSFVQT